MKNNDFNGQQAGADPACCPFSVEKECERKNKSRCQKPIDFEEVFCYILVENKEKGNNNLCWH